MVGLKNLEMTRMTNVFVNRQKNLDEKLKKWMIGNNLNRLKNRRGKGQDKTITFLKWKDSLILMIFVQN